MSRFFQECLPVELYRVLIEYISCSLRRTFKRSRESTHLSILSIELNFLIMLHNVLTYVRSMIPFSRLFSHHFLSFLSCFCILPLFFATAYCDLAFFSVTGSLALQWLQGCFPLTSSTTHASSSVADIGCIQHCNRSIGAYIERKVYDI